jgi:hypothetical protein
MLRSTEKNKEQFILQHLSGAHEKNHRKKYQDDLYQNVKNDQTQISENKQQNLKQEKDYTLFTDS